MDREGNEGDSAGAICRKYFHARVEQWFHSKAWLEIPPYQKACFIRGVSFFWMITDPILLQRNLQDDVNFCSLCDRKASVRGNAEVTLIGFNMMLSWNTRGGHGVGLALASQRP